MRTLLLAALAALLAGCASAPVSQVQGNGYCHPAQDLPSHKAVQPAPEADTPMDDLYALLAAERQAHAADDRDYNSLYSTCVGGSDGSRAALSPKQ